MLNTFLTCLGALCLIAFPGVAQEPAGSASQPLERITGAIISVDPGGHTITVKEDGTGAMHSVELRNTKSLRKVDPGTLDLKKATRITAEDLMVGDRVQVFGLKAEDDPKALAARGVILISARALESVHQEQAAAWQRSTGGVVTQVDTPGGKLSISARTPQGLKPMVVDAQKAEFTRYSPENPKVPAVSKLAEIQVGDQVRVIAEANNGEAHSGEANGDGSILTAQRIYSSSMRMLGCTVTAVSPDGKRITVKDLQTKQSVTVALNDDSAVRKLPPAVAFGLARRLNPSQAAGGDHGPAGSNVNVGSEGANGRGVPPSEGRPADGSRPNAAWKGGANGAPDGSGAAGAGGPGGGGFRPGGGSHNGDLSQLIERLPKISATDLKPGDALLIAGTPVGNDKSNLLATNVIAGVEPIFQSASPRQMQSLGDWGLSSGSGMDGMPAQ